MAILVGDVLNGVPRTITWDKMVAFESVIWDRGPTAHNDPSTAGKGGMSKPFASGQNVLAFMHELLEQSFGRGWVEGGRISVRWTRVVYENDIIRPCLQVTAIDRVAGRDRASFDIWAENQDGERTAAGTASAFLS